MLLSYTCIFTNHYYNFVRNIIVHISILFRDLSGLHFYRNLHLFVIIPRGSFHILCTHVSISTPWPFLIRGCSNIIFIILLIYIVCSLCDLLLSSELLSRGRIHIIDLGCLYSVIVHCKLRPFLFLFNIMTYVLSL